MEKKRIAFIVNPISGTHQKDTLLNLIDRKIDHTRFDYTIQYTEYAGHAPLLVKQCIADRCEAVVAVGGDGTVNEIARSLVHTPVALGIIPCGSGNGLARHLQIPMEPQGAIDIINSYTLKYLDYGTINDLPFFCTCGVGFDAFVSSKFAHSSKRGALSYLDYTLREGVKYTPDTYEIEIEGETTSHKAFLIACANASQYGNNAYIAPHASMQDGLMDVTIMEPFPVIEAPQIVFQLFNKTLNHNSHIRMFRCSHITIHREKEGVIHYDGDPVMAGTEIDVRLIKAGLRVIVNNKKKKKTTNGIGQMFMELCSEVVRMSADAHKRNLKMIDEFNQQVKKKLGL